MRYTAITAAGILGGVDGLLLLGNPSWFNPFVGVLFLAVLPHIGAMILIWRAP